MKQIHKEYSKSFLLEPTKFTRLLDKIHERLSEHPNTTKRDHFEVFMSGNRREEMASIDEVLKIENSRKHKIQRIVIACSASGSAAHTEHEVHVDFGVSPTRVQGETTQTQGKVVAVSVHSDASGWAARTLSEVEEQLERTWLLHTPPLVALVVLVAAVIVAFVFLFGPERVPRYETMNSLTDTDVARVAQMLSADRTLTEEQTREVTTMQLRNVVLDRTPPPIRTRGTQRNVILFGVPLLGLFGLACTLMTQYPGAVFLWGDEVARHDGRLQRRKVLWTILLITLPVGIMIKLFLKGAASWIPS